MLAPSRFLGFAARFRFVPVLLLVLVLASCTTAEPAPSEAPKPTPGETVQLRARAFGRACLLANCAGAPIYAPADTPQELRDAISEIFSDEVEYLDQVTLEERSDEEGRYPSRATLIVIGPSHGTERPDVVGVDVMTSRGIRDMEIHTSLFRWDGRDWVDAQPKDTGVTVTSSVS